jgi:hypothetical protein
MEVEGSDEDGLRNSVGGDYKQSDKYHLLKQQEEYAKYEQKMKDRHVK